MPHRPTHADALVQPVDEGAGLGVVDRLEMARQDGEIAEDLLRGVRTADEATTHDEDAVHVLLDRQVGRVDVDVGGVEPLQPRLVERAVRLRRVSRRVGREPLAECNDDGLSDQTARRASDIPATGCDGRPAGRRW